MSTNPAPQSTINLRPAQAAVTLLSMLVLSALLIGMGIQGLVDAYAAESVREAIGTTVLSVIGLAIGSPLLGWFIIIILDLTRRDQ